MNPYILLLAITIGAPLAAAQADLPADAAVIGTWEGESKCTVPNSPCHDEHVIYEISRDEKTGGQKIEAYKIVNGEKDFMGALLCTYKAEKKVLACSGGNPRQKSDWQFSVSQDTIRGTLVIGDEKTLYRRITLQRKSH